MALQVNTVKTADNTSIVYGKMIAVFLLILYLQYLYGSWKTKQLLLKGSVLQHSITVFHHRSVHSDNTFLCLNQYYLRYYLRDIRCEDKMTAFTNYFPDFTFVNIMQVHIHNTSLIMFFRIFVDGQKNIILVALNITHILFPIFRKPKTLSPFVIFTIANTILMVGN